MFGFGCLKGGLPRCLIRAQSLCLSEHASTDYSYHDPLQGISEETKECIKAGILRTQLESRLSAGSVEELRCSLGGLGHQTEREDELEETVPAPRPKRIAKARERCVWGETGF